LYFSKVQITVKNRNNFNSINVHNKQVTDGTYDDMPPALCAAQKLATLKIASQLPKCQCRPQ